MATIMSVSTGGAVTDAPAQRYVDLADVVGGALVAAAVTMILMTFGSAIGLSMTDPGPGEGPDPVWIAIAGGIWVIWTAVSSAAAGGYFAGRMRRPVGDADPDEVETRDGAHGIAVWALATLITVLLTAAGVGGVVRAVGEVVSGAAPAVAEAAGDDLGALTRNDVEYRAGIALRGNGLAEDRGARDEVIGVITRGLEDGQVGEDDRAWLARVVASQAGVTTEQARARVDRMISEAEEARREAIEAAEAAHKFALVGAFVAAASMLVSAAAGYFAAVLGGKHRNENVGFANAVFASRRRVPPPTVRPQSM